MSLSLLPDTGVARSLSSAVRRRLERLFRAELSALRIRETPLPPGLGALASGHTVWIAPGFYRPGTPRGDALLAHEVAHLFQQQRRGAAPGGPAGPRLLVDRALEVEADLWACLVLCAPAVAVALNAPGGGALAAAASGVAQPWILMASDTGDDPDRYGLEDYSPRLRFGTDYFRSADDERGKPHEAKFHLLTRVEPEWEKVRQAYKFLFGNDLEPPEQMRALLVSWMGAPDAVPESVREHMVDDVLKNSPGPADMDPRAREKLAMDVRGHANVRGEMRYYHTYGELTYALWQEMRSLQALADEALQAAVLLHNDNVDRQLARLGEKVASHARKEENRARVQQHLDKPAAYGPLHGRETLDAVLDALAAGQPEKGGKHVALLHDAKDLYARAKLIDSGEPGYRIALEKGVDKELDISKYNSRYNLGTPDEADAWVAWMRDNERPVWAGPSYTMVHMWKMGQAAGGTRLELEAMGYAMFAFWNAGTPGTYPITSTPVHRFHETLAAARMFDVPYEPEADIHLNMAGFFGRLTEDARPMPPNIPQIRAKL